MKLLNGVMFAAFALSIAVQYNDPDPVAWIALYGSAAACCGLFWIGLRFWWAPAIVCFAALAWIGLSIPGLAAAEDPIVWGDVFGQPAMKTMAVELVREIGGLAIVAIWMAVLAVRFRQPRRA